MKTEPSIFDIPDEDADELAAREGEADADAGRTIPQSEMADWLKTWGTSEEKPAPAKWFK